jgi:hydroxyacyl-ACP dehydratase HTD2-like protein with hotdog domain
MNISLEGKSYPEIRFLVDEDHVQRFRRAIGSPGISVPVTFVTVAEFSSFPAIVGDPELALDFSRVVHADQEYEFSRPLRVGETVTVRSRIAQARARGGQSFLTIETRLLDEDAVVVVTARTTMLERGPA